MKPVKIHIFIRGLIFVKILREICGKYAFVKKKRGMLKMKTYRI